VFIRFSYAVAARISDNNPIPCTPLADDIPGISGVIFQLLPEIVDVDLELPDVRKVLVTPDFLEQLPM